MILHPKIAEKYLKLSLGTNAKHIKCTRESMTVVSNFDDEWYNFIIPNTSEPESLNEIEFNNDVEEFKRLDKKHSIYINSEYQKSYAKWLESNGYELFGDDVYLVGSFNKPGYSKISDEYTNFFNYDIDEVGEMLYKSFPDWPEEIEYSKYYEELKVQGQEDRVFATAVLNYEEKPVAAGSVVIDRVLGIGYLHNSGVLEEHRRKGLHSNLISGRINLSIANGVNTILAIVEKDGASYKNFKTFGFKEECTYLIYSKKA